LICGFPALAEAFPVQSRGWHSSLIEDAKGRVIMLPTKPVVVRKSSSPSFSLTIIRKEQRRPRKKAFVIPDIPKPK
jgi:hypothetical protein